MCWVPCSPIPLGSIDAAPVVLVVASWFELSGGLGTIYLRKKFSKVFFSTTFPTVCFLLAALRSSYFDLKGGRLRL